VLAGEAAAGGRAGVLVPRLTMVLVHLSGSLGGLNLSYYTACFHSKENFPAAPPKKAT